ncbi:glycosyltransferase family 4 protein [candidate division KSB1 bacterium]|nr:glycosyltransferase family 4 protein [candidate division KSB1 bacterium]
MANFYIDNYSYQENILPKMHKLQGHDVAILASTETYIDNIKLEYVEPRSYHTKEGIPITRIPYVSILPHFLIKKVRIYKGISKVVSEFNPDIIFLHDVQFISIVKIVSYVKKHQNVRIYADGHADFIKHEGRSFIFNWLSERVLHGIIYKWCAKRIEPYTRKYYGVLPIRVDFFKSVYGIPEDKVELLVMGADDSVFDLTKKNEIRSSIRKKLNLFDDDFVVVTGAKIDHRKNINILMKAMHEIKEEKIKLIVFGTPSNDIKKEIEELSMSNNIKYIGWISSDNVYDYFLSADLGFFPGTHSVFWEQAVGVGLPCVFKKWVGEQHVDVGGNCLFIETADIKEIKEKILLLYHNRSQLMKMKQVAEEKGIPYFSYSQISKRAIED